MFPRPVLALIFALCALLAACSSAYNLTDRSENVFVVEKPELSPKSYFEYRVGDAVRELKPEDIVSLSIPNAEPRIFDGKVFYPATLALEDTVSVPAKGFICVEGMITVKNAGAKLTMPIANIKEFSRKQDKEENAEGAEGKEENKEETKEEKKEE